MNHYVIEQNVFWRTKKYDNKHNYSGIQPNTYHANRDNKRNEHLVKQLSHLQQIGRAHV